MESCLDTPEQNKKTFYAEIEKIKAKSRKIFSRQED